MPNFFQAEFPWKEVRSATTIENVVRCPERSSCHSKRSLAANIRLIISFKFIYFPLISISVKYQEELLVDHTHLWIRSRQTISWLITVNIFYQWPYFCLFFQLQTEHSALLTISKCSITVLCPYPPFLKKHHWHIFAVHNNEFIKKTD